MKNDSLVIMAGGASSRMKKSLTNAGLDTDILAAAQNWHKSLIPLDDKKRPMLYFLLQNAVKAGIQNIYLVTSLENAPFYHFQETFKNDRLFEKLKMKIAVQYIPENRSKPLGTADAVEQCMDQYTELQDQRFTVCNGDNLYSSNVMKLLKQERSAPHATIAYQGSGLGFNDERLSKFAVMHIDSNNYLKQIVEKPALSKMNQYRDEKGDLSISMNIFNFSGCEMYSFLKNCPINPVRDEKELPEAVRAAVRKNNASVYTYKVSEMLPDLTTAEDIKKMNLYL